MLVQRVRKLKLPHENSEQLAVTSTAMPPKNKGKNGKKGAEDDDAHWCDARTLPIDTELSTFDRESKAAALESKPPPQDEVEERAPAKNSKSGGNIFELLENGDDDDDGGGLLVTLVLQYPS